TNFIRRAGRASRLASGAPKPLSRRFFAAGWRRSWSLSRRRARLHQERPKWQRIGKRCGKNCERRRGILEAVASRTFMENGRKRAVCLLPLTGAFLYYKDPHTLFGTHQLMKAKSV